jgi:GntR family transcriptional regulator/MocR family aminotransferase
LYAQIKEDILSGNLLPESKLISARKLAVEQGVSRNTVESAYQQLYTEGYIDSKPRSGYYVIPIEKPLASRLARDFSPTEIKTIGSESCRFDFHPARLARQSFPLKIWNRLWRECNWDNDQLFLFYGDPQGEPSLRREIQKYLAKSRGVSCSPSQIVICSGLQHSLSTLCQIIKGEFSACAVEDPGYFVARSVFQNHSLEVVPVPVGRDGLIIPYLAGTRCRAVYVTPSHQFPLGWVMPISERLKLLAWAEKVNGLIIEDDYDSEFRYQGQPIPSLQGLNPQGNTVYLGTFSKTLSPSLRVSYMVLPESLLEIFQQLFRNHSSSVSLLEQKILQKFMEQGFWESHLRRLRTLYRKKHEVLTSAVRQFLGDKAVILSQDAGLHIVIEVSGSASGKELSQQAKGKGVCVHPVTDYSMAKDSYKNAVILGFGGMSPAEISRGIELLSQAWSEPSMK